MTNRNISIGIMMIIAAITIFSNLAGFPLLDPDEPVYAETPKEMLLYHDFLSPKIYGEYWYDKPPMYYWLVVGAYQCFGINDFAARFPSALLALLSVGCMYLYGKRLFNHNVGIYSALILTSSIEFFYLSKAAVTDITLMLCLMISLFAFASKQFYLYYFFAGLAVLTKGPIGLFFVGIIVLLYLLGKRDLNQLLKMKLFSGSVIFCIVSLPWYAYMYHVHGSAFIDTFLGFHNITRFTSPEHPSGLLWYYYIPVLCIGFFPWISVIFQAIYRSFIDSQKHFNTLFLLNIWAFTVFLFFSVSKTKLVSYILPMFPALALILGWYMDKIIHNDFFSQKRHFTWIGLLSLFSGIFIYGCYIGVHEMAKAKLGFLSLGIVIGLMLISTVCSLIKNKIAYAFWSNVVGMMVFSVVLVYSIFPVLAPDFTAYHVSKNFSQQYDGTSHVYVSKFLRPGFSFYTGFYGEELAFSNQSIPDLEKIFESNTKSYFVLRDIDYARLPRDVVEKLIIIDEVDNKMILLEKRFNK